MDAGSHESRWASTAIVTDCLACLVPLCSAAVFCSIGSQTLALKLIPAFGLGVAILALIGVFAKRIPIGWTGEPPTHAAILLSAIGIGLMLRVAFGLLVHPAAVSDMASYDFSARHLLGAHEYVCREAHFVLRAFRPPGVAFLLAGMMAIVGQQPWAALLLNCILYIGTSILLWQALRFLPWHAGAFALGMLAIWPSEVDVASLPQSETPSIFFSAVLLWVLVRVENPWSKTILLGVLTGLSCLLRNSNLLLIGVWWFVLLQSPVPFRKRVAMSALVVVSAFAPILPWTLRNNQVLGKPVLVATNGGSNFYSANNSLSSGGWEGTSEIELSKYLPDEVAMDNAGFSLAKQWIRTHPVQFATLGFQKVRRLLGTDDWGPYWAMERGHGYTGAGYTTDLAAAGLWWVALWAAVLIGFLRQPRLISQEVLLQAVVAFTIVPSFLFFVFQSQARYHAFMIPGLLFLAVRLNSFRTGSYAAREGR